jgi:hypothetical protein
MFRFILRKDINIKRLHCGMGCGGVGEITRLGYALDDLGVRILAGARYLPLHPHQLSGANNFLFNGYRGFIPLVVKRPEREADHLPPSGAEVENE